MDPADLLGGRGAVLSRRRVIYLLAEHADLTVNAQSAGILTVLVFGAGTDYALLLVARYREELRLHEDRHEAMTEALHRAGPAIIASGGTVVLGMLCLLFAGHELDQGLGPVAAIGIAVDPRRAHDPAAGAAGHLRPLGVLAGAARRWAAAEPSATGIWARVGARIARARGRCGSSPRAAPRRRCLGCSARRQRA